jgi:hypothetical protein
VQRVIFFLLSAERAESKNLQSLRDENRLATSFELTLLEAIVFGYEL